MRYVDFSAGERPPVMPDNGVVHQQIYSGDERIVSSSSSVGPSLYYNVLQNHTNLYPYDWNAAGKYDSLFFYSLFVCNV